MQALEPVLLYHPCLLLFIFLKLLLPLNIVITVIVSCGGKKGTSKRSGKSQSAKRRPTRSDPGESDGSDAAESMAKTTATTNGTVPPTGATTGPTQTEYLMAEINGQPPTCRNQAMANNQQTCTQTQSVATGRPHPGNVMSTTATPDAKTAATAPIPTAPITTAGTLKRANTTK